MKMNQKKLLLLALLLTVSSLVFAQGIVAKGFKGGLNITNFSGNDVPNEFESKLGFTIGGFVTYKVNPTLSFQPEFLFTTKGAKIEETYYGETATYSENLSYIEVPLLAKINLTNTGNVRPVLFAGPALAINVAATVKMEYDGQDESDDLENINPINFDLVIGGGIDTEKITFDVRYDLSLSKLHDFEDPVDAYNSGISFLVGIKLN